MKKFSLLVLICSFTLTLSNMIYPAGFSDKGFSFTQITGDTVYYDNFENGLNGWTVYNLSNPPLSSLWHLTTLRYVSQNHSLGWYDSLTNSYPHSRYEALVSPPLTIPSNAKVYLSFDVFIHLAPFQTGNDNFDIQITTDNGSTWTDFSQYAYSGQQIGWKNFPSDYIPGETGDLTSYAGKTVKIRFLISTDNLDPNGEGVFIDNFRIIKVDCDFPDLFEPNNSIATAAPITQGQNLTAALCPVGDLDYYSFQVSQNDRINIVASHNVFQITLTLINQAGNIVASTGNKQLNYTAVTGGLYKLKVSYSDIFTSTPQYGLYMNIIKTTPDVISVTDIPDDQGLKVRVQWQYSLFDPPDAAGTIKEYHLFRKVTDTSSFSGRILKAEEITSDSRLGGNLILLQNEYWDYVGTVPAISPRPFSNYVFTAPTLKDSSEFTFKVAAVTKTANQPVLWGDNGSGMSFDNVSPRFSDYSLSAGEDGITIIWDIDNTLYSDVQEVRIYKGMFQRFAPAGSSMIGAMHPSTHSYTDPELNSGSQYYILAIKDFAGNINYTSPLEATISSVPENNFIPEQISLRQNYPNPFNPVTTIEFYLPASGNISLKVYDVLGREISELAKGNFQTGLHRIPFAAGNLPSGTYFYTLTAGEFSETKKLILIK
jgi:hypothetical protein